MVKDIWNSYSHRYGRIKQIKTPQTPTNKPSNPPLQDSTHNNKQSFTNESNNPIQSEVKNNLLILKIEVSKDLIKPLHFFDGDNPRTVATNFVLQNNLDSKMTDKIEKEIRKQLLINIADNNDKENSNKPFITETPKRNSSKKNSYSTPRNYSDKNIAANVTGKGIYQMCNLGEQLYYRGMKQMETSRKKTLERANSYKEKKNLELTFRPKINSSSKKMFESSINRSQTTRNNISSDAFLRKMINSSTTGTVDNTKSTMQTKTVEER